MSTVARSCTWCEEDKVWFEKFEKKPSCVQGGNGKRKGTRDRRDPFGNKSAHRPERIVEFASCFPVAVRPGVRRKQCGVRDDNRGAYFQLQEVAVVDEVDGGSERVIVCLELLSSEN